MNGKPVLPGGRFVCELPFVLREEEKIEKSEKETNRMKRVRPHRKNSSIFWLFTLWKSCKGKEFELVFEISNGYYYTTIYKGETIGRSFKVK